jgi:hypothetical protein
MKNLLIVILFLVSSTLYSQKYKVVANIGTLRLVGFDIPNRAITDVDTTIYYAPTNSLFTKISRSESGTETTDKDIVVKFDYVPPNIKKTVDVGTRYYLSKEIFNSYSVRFYSGLDYGLLVIPFKLRFNPGSISPGTALGPYIGYKLGSDSNLFTSIVTTLSLAGVSLNDVNSQNVKNVLGLTYGGGVILNFNNKIQVGAILGADYIGEQGKDWNYQNKLWLSIAIGFTFLR